jgi:diguanylate cyclase (GGDEF)-like protein
MDIETRAFGAVEPLGAPESDAAATSALLGAASAWNGDTTRHLIAIITGLASVVDSHVYVLALAAGGYRSIFEGPGLENLLGVRELPDGESVDGALFRSCVHPHDQATHERVVASADAQPGHASSAEYRLVGVDGVTRWIHHSRRVRATAGEVFVDGSLRDITAERDAIAKLRSGEPSTARERRRLHDPLTGAANRELLLQTISETAGELTVLYVDIDAFKELNDRYGPICGDEALRAVADRLRSVLRPTDLIARVGGDEFAAVCRTEPGSNVYVIIQRLAAAFFEPVEYGGLTRRIGISVGLAQRPADAHGEDPMEVVLRAEESMHADKRRSQGAR